MRHSDSLFSLMRCIEAWHNFCTLPLANWSLHCRFQFQLTFSQCECLEPYNGDLQSQLAYMVCQFQFQLAFSQCECFLNRTIVTSSLNWVLCMESIKNTWHFFYCLNVFFKFSKLQHLLYDIYWATNFLSNGPSGVIGPVLLRNEANKLSDWGPRPVADLPHVKRKGFACDAAAVRLILDSRKHITNPNKPLPHEHTTQSCRTTPKPLHEIGEFLSSPWRSRGFFSASPSPPPCYCSSVSRLRLPASIYILWCAPTQRSLIRSDLFFVSCRRGEDEKVWRRDGAPDRR
jgi:hypothetical protein